MSAIKKIFSLESWLGFISQFVKFLIENPKKARDFARKTQILIGLSLIIFSLNLGKKSIYLLFRGEPALGIIVDFRKTTWTSNGKNGSWSRSSYTPIVEYSKGGPKFRFQETFGTSRVGDLNVQVDVLYDPDNPEKGMIKKNLLNWIPWILFFSVGFFLLSTGVRSKVKD